MTGETKPGWRTTEFWITAGVTLSTLLGSLGVIPTERSELVDVGGQVSLMMLAIVTIGHYISGRNGVKGDAGKIDPAAVIRAAMDVAAAARPAGEKEPGGPAPPSPRAGG